MIVRGKLKQIETARGESDGSKVDTGRRWSVAVGNSRRRRGDRGTQQRPGFHSWGSTGHRGSGAPETAVRRLVERADCSRRKIFRSNRLKERSNHKGRSRRADRSVARRG